MILANIKDCTACMACVDICSHQALSATIDANGYYKVLTTLLSRKSGQVGL